MSEPQTPSGRALTKYGAAVAYATAENIVRIERQARDAVLDALEAAVGALRVEAYGPVNPKPMENWGNEARRRALAQVLEAIQQQRRQPERPHHDPTDHDCRGGAPGDPAPF